DRDCQVAAAPREDAALGQARRDAADRLPPEQGMTDSRHHDEALTHALRAVADDDRLLSASAGIEARLLNEALGIVRARRRRAWTTAGVLALVAAAIAIPAWRAATDRASAPGSPDSAAATTPAAGEDLTEF